MSKQSDLLQTLGGDRAEQSEFEQVVLQHFGHAAHRTNEEIAYGSSQGGADLTLIYDGDGLLIGADARGDLSVQTIPALADKVREKLLTPGLSRVRRRVLFTAIPVQGSYRYADMFQIFPVPAEAPRPPFILGDHPFFLEFKYPASSDFMISNLRQERIGRELELVCSSLFSHRVWGIGPQTQFHWSMEFIAGQLPPSKFLQEGYAWPGAITEIDDFSPADGVPPLAQLDAQTYYSRRGISPDQVLDLPADFRALLDAVLRLSRDDRDRFLRSSYWFQHAQVTFPKSKSAAFVALVSAVEALIPASTGKGRCPECGQMTGPGATQQFADFIEAHLPGTDISERERKRFYRLRSALSHGGRLLLGDHSMWGFTPSSLGEGSDMRVMWQIVHTVLRAWLSAR